MCSSVHAVASMMLGPSLLWQSTKLLPLLNHLLVADKVQCLPVSLLQLQVSDSNFSSDQCQC